MSVKAVDHAPRKKTTKAILSAAAAVISYTIAYILLYNYNNWTEIPGWFFMPTYGALTALLAFCAAELITTLFQYFMIKHVVTAAIVTLLELTPLPYIWVYLSLSYDSAFEGEGGRIASMWKTAAVIFVIIMLFMTGVNLFKRRCRIKISVEKNDRKSSGEPPLEKGRLALLYLYI